MIFLIKIIFIKQTDSKSLSISSFYDSPVFLMPSNKLSNGRFIETIDGLILFYSATAWLKHTCPTLKWALLHRSKVSRGPSQQFIAPLGGKTKFKWLKCMYVHSYF